ncbi:MAG TPA: carboxypeptidase regulatory-like domain-containing protein [Candidatus Baltobacteraceae bacterium]|nr:carboxypeptidase regulatory-like domain-containing protein [Candidatus Baltobacteraceae bacterium]
MTFKLLPSLRSAAFLLLLFVAAFGAARPLYAQSAGTGSLTGTVTDPSGAIVPNVTVTAKNAATGQSYQATTGTDGVYRFSLLPPGKYDVKFEAPQFKTIENLAATVNVTETTVLNQTLQVGGQTQVVQVQANTQGVDTATSTLGTLVSGNQITALPLTSRNYTQVLDMSAGVSASVNDAAILGKGTQLTSVNGANPSQNNYQMDGVAINNAGNLGNGGDQSVSAGIGIPNPDAIEEFKIQTSTYDASYGRNPGGNVNVVTKSGTNQFHGDAFEFFRNTVLNSNDFFVGKAILDQNQFGGTLGGPIKKDKLFFFFSYQGTRSKNGIAPQGLASGVFLPNIPNEARNTPQFATDLANATCTGITFGPPVHGPAATCGPNQGPENIGPVALAVLNLAGPGGKGYYIPTPSTDPSCSPAGPEYLCNFSDPALYSEDQYIGNADYVINSRETLQTRFFYTKNPQVATLGGYLPGEPQTNYYSNDNAVLKLSSILTNSFTNEARVSFQRNYGTNSDTPPDGATPESLGITPAFAGAMYPPGIWTLVDGVHLFDSFSPAKETTNQFQAADQIAWSHGRHTIRAGFEYERVQYWVTAGAARGFLLMGSFEDFLVGGPGNIYLNLSNKGTAGNGEQLHGYRLNDADSFVQDDWKVNSRLTLNLGLRWEFDGNLHDKYGNLTNIWPSLLASTPPPDAPLGVAANYIGYVVPHNYTTKYGNPALPDGVLRTGTGYSLSSHAPYSNFAPRFGFAWQPTHSSNLVVRGGFGLFYDRVWFDAFVHGFQGNSPYGVSLNYGPAPNTFTLANPFPNYPLETFLQRYSSVTCSPDGLTCPGSSSELDTNFISSTIHTPLVQQYNLNVQYEFAPSWVLQVGYVGSSGINLMDIYRNYNTAQLATPENPINGQTVSTLENINLRVPYLGYSPAGLQGTDFVGSSNYNSLQVTLQKHFSHGLTMQAAYTWSKSLSDLVPDAATGGYLGANSNDPQDLAQQYGPSFYNRPQRLSVNYEYEFPNLNREGITGRIVSGWSVAGVTTVQDGNPLTLTDATAGSIYGIPNARAELCPGDIPLKNPGSIESQLANGATYLNSAALCAPPIIGDGTGFGDSGVGIVLGPGQFNWDISLIKETKIREGQSLVFRTEFYNAFNHPQFANPATAKGFGYGAITATSVNPRLIQFALKYVF